MGGGAGGSRGILGAKTRRAISGDTRGTHNPGILGAGIRQRDFPRTVGAPSGPAPVPRLGPSSAATRFRGGGVSIIGPDGGRRSVSPALVESGCMARTVAHGIRFPIRWR